MAFDLAENSHRRFNPLTREWVLVSPHRTNRPWQGQVEKPNTVLPPKYDPDCYLCPTNKRAGGHQNPDYKTTFVFDNDFAALQPSVPEAKLNTYDLLIAESERGICRVICFSPDHSLTLSRMDSADIEKVVDEWAAQFSELGQLDYVNYVQIFENRGEMMGASNPHPHCQIWATESIPNEPTKELIAQQQYSENGGKCLLCDYVKLELAANERIVCENASFAALVPFWAVYPFEVMILPKEHCNSIGEFDEKERIAFADTLKRVTTRYDNLFLTPFPYSMGFHQRPTDGKPHDSVHFHAHFYPPLLRSATVRKFLVGFEILGSPQRDTTPESAAARLRELSEIHYLDAGVVK
ncbi:MAG: UDP-glucose--hexose-1-phosphate uridylyltransferase [Acidobacteriota bacterium]